MTRLNLTRPIVFFDLEATGTDPQNDRIVEIAAVKLLPDGQREEKSKRFNPGVPIPAEATAVHGITDADVQDEPAFARVAKGIAAFFTDADLGGFNVLRYDIPLLLAELQRAGVAFDMNGVAVVDTFRIYVEHEPRDLPAAVRFYCEREHEDAHSAASDVTAAIDVLESQLGQYDDLADSPEALDARDPDAVDVLGKLRRVDGEVVITFGKNAGKPLRQVVQEDPSYIQWMIREGVVLGGDETLREALSAQTAGQ